MLGSGHVPERRKGIRLSNSTENLKSYWGKIFPANTTPHDEQFVLWQLRHTDAVVRRAIYVLYRKYRKEGGKMGSEHMAKYASAAMNRFTEELRLAELQQREDTSRRK